MMAWRSIIIERQQTPGRWEIDANTCIEQADSVAGGIC